MGLFSGILNAVGLGGSKTTVTTQQVAQNTTNVDVQSNITNVIDTESLTQAFKDFFGIFNQNTEAATAATIGAALVSAKVQQQTGTQVAESIRQGLLSLGWVLVGALGVYWLFKGKRS